MFTAGLRVFEEVTLGLTPAERFQAAGRFESGNTVWFVVIFGVIALALVVVLATVVWEHSRQKDKSGKDKFLEQAQKRGLSSRESQILLRVAKLTGLKKVESIFTMERAFDIGTGKVLDSATALRMTDEQIKRLGEELAYIREKLGFKKKLMPVTEPVRRLRERSSREIPLGKRVYMTRRLGRDSENIEAIIIKNTDNVLAVRLAVALESSIGERWCVRYYYGASVWEFDVSVVGSEGDVLILNHSDNIRFINRRRFLRVPVRRKAYIAPFAFERQIAAKSSRPGTNLADVFDEGVVLPRFVPATVTQLAGPGLLIETSLPLEARQRVAVIFDLDVYDDPDGTARPVRARKIVEDIGIVRHTSQAEKGYSVAVELTGLSDFDVNGLIRATNAAAAKANLRTGNTEDSSARRRESAGLAAVGGG